MIEVEFPHFISVCDMQSNIEKKFILFLNEHLNSSTLKKITDVKHKLPNIETDKIFKWELISVISLWIKNLHKGTSY